MLHGNGYGFDYFAHCTYEKGKSFFSLGPIIGLKLKLGSQYDNYPISGRYGLSGFHAVYQLSPKQKGKSFSAYLQYEFIFQYYSYKGEAIVQPTTNPWIPEIKSYKSNFTNIEHCIGFGCKEKFLKNFYANQSIGFGFRSDSKVIDYGDINYNRNLQYGWAPGVMLKIGVGYIFKKKSKRVVTTFG